MDWEPPAFTEIRMDAELTSYVADDETVPAVASDEE
jgi:coenzyme PQQ precursor peptide PqqA